MSTSPDPKPAGSVPGWVQGLLQRRKSTAYGLFLLAAGLVALAVTLGIYYPAEAVPVGIWCGAMALISLGAGLWMLMHVPQRFEELDEDTRLGLLIVGGCAGLATFVAGIVLVYWWWADLSTWLQPGGAVKNAWRGGVALLAILGGLFVMFLSVQLGRAAERTSVHVRRLVYGYNAVLTALLLLATLVVVNVLVANPRFGASLDFTAASIYTLSPRSVSILTSLKQPVTITHLMGSRDSFIDTQVETMLANCREVTDKVQVKTLSVHQLDEQRTRELREKYPDLEEGCLLITYGSDDKADHRVIKADDLGTPPRMGRDPSVKQHYKFTGEDALMTELSFLSEGRKKSVVYVTQGNGELDLNDRSAERPGIGAGMLKERLEKRNYEVKELKFSPGDAKVPDDASVVIIAGPRNPIPDFGLKALRDYMTNRNGKLVVLLDPVIDRDGHMVPTGMENFLAAYNVQVPPQRILSLPDNLYVRTPLQVVVVMNRKLTGNLLVQAFPDPLRLTGARPILAVPPQPERAMQSPVVAEPLLLTWEYAWAEDNLSKPPSELADEVASNRDVARKKLLRKEPLSVGVVVTQPVPNPNDPHGGMMGGGERKPRLVVFGVANLASNAYIPGTFDLFSSSLLWLEEKKGGIGIQPKVYEFYQMSPGTQYTRMLFLPLGVVAIGIIGLGAGVWVVRRR